MKTKNREKFTGTAVLASNQELENCFNICRVWKTTDLPTGVRVQHVEQLGVAVHSLKGIDLTKLDFITSKVSEDWRNCKHFFPPVSYDELWVELENIGYTIPDAVLFCDTGIVHGQPRIDGQIMNVNNLTL